MSSCRKHFTLAESAHGGGAVQNAQMTPTEVRWLLRSSCRWSYACSKLFAGADYMCVHSQAKEANQAHKEEIRHTHDKGMANLSNAAVRF